MGVEFDAHLIPGMDGQVGVVALLFGQIANLVDQGQRLFKVLELDVARQLAILRGCPAWHLLHHRLYLLAAQRWRIAPTRYALPGSQLCHCVLLTVAWRRKAAARGCAAELRLRGRKRK